MEHHHSHVDLLSSRAAICEKEGHIIIKCCRTNKYLRIPGPTQPLIPLRAIRRYIQKVASVVPIQYFAEVYSEVDGSIQKCR